MNIADMMNEERQRLQKRLGELAEQMSAIDTQVTQVQIELSAITAYENAKEGKPPGRKFIAAPKSGVRRLGIRKNVLDVLTAAPGGVRRAELMEKFGAKGDKVKEQSVTNALANLKRTNDITLEYGMYKVSAKL